MRWLVRCPVRPAATGPARVASSTGGSRSCTALPRCSTRMICPGAEDEELSDAELATCRRSSWRAAGASDTPVAVEAPFEMVVGGRLLRGRIDAVYPREDGGFDVIDFKTGTMPKGADFEAASLQLSIYRLAWADLAEWIRGCDGGFLYVRDSHVERPAKLLDRDELARCSAEFRRACNPLAEAPRSGAGGDATFWRSQPSGLA